MPTDVRCLICNSFITDPDFRVVLCQEEYPDIEIGPYCETCMGKIKICSGCQHPVLGNLCKGNDQGDFYCPTCAESMSSCQSCGSIKSSNDLKDINGTTLCSRCVDRDYFLCNSCTTHHLKDAEVKNNSLEGLQRAGVFRKYKRVCRNCFETKKNAFKFYDIRRCNNCSSHYTFSEGEHDHYCSRCYDSFYTCAICGKKDHNVKNRKADLSKFPDKTTIPICSTCMNGLLICSYCGRATDDVSHKVLIGKSKISRVCKRCKDLKECKNCGSFGLLKEDGYCNTCHQTYISNKCSSCERVRDGGGRCRVCDGSHIYNYSTKPHLFFNYDHKKETKDGSMFFGFENECTFGSSNSKMNAGLINLFSVYDPTVLIAKSDGSIAGNGYEVVTQPMTLRFFHGLDLSSILPVSLERSSSCGLHIHVGRKHFLSDVHLFKVINLLRDNPRFAEFAAGRQSNGYSCKVPNKASRYIKDAKNHSTERRCMVNLTNSSTVEFRLFAGCIKEFELRGRFEFLYALILFCRDASIVDAKSVSKFIDYLNKNKKMYPNAVDLFSKFTI